MIHDLAWAFFAAPSLETAERLLDAYNVTVPFRELMRQPSSIPQESAEAAKPNAKRLKRNATHGGTDKTDEMKKQLDTLSRLDVLHDLHTKAPMPFSTIDFVLSDANLSPPDHERVVLACQDGRTNITHLFSTMMGLPQTQRKRRRVNLQESLLQDHRLYALVLEWQQRKKLEIVMDGIVTVPSFVSHDEPDHVQKAFVQALFMHAFVMILLGRYDAVSRLPIVKLTLPDRPPSSTESMVFLYGVFQWMDIGGWKSFLKKWINVMEGIMIPYSRRVSIQYIPSRTIMPYSNRFVVDEAQKTVFVDGVSVSMHSPTPSNKGILKTKTQMMDYYEAGFGVTYTKEHLKAMFSIFDGLPHKEQQKRTPFMRRVMDVNSFRDAYKADVALRRNAIYITFDRLAYAYYVLRGSSENRQHYGLFYSVTSPSEVELLSR